MATTLTQFLAWWISHFAEGALKKAADLECSLKGVTYEELPPRFSPGLKSWRQTSKSRRKVLAARVLAQTNYSRAV